MPFQFVDNNAAIDPAARKRIRSHVAMGRNAGKKLIRTSRKNVFELKSKTTTAGVYTPNTIDATRHRENSREIVPEIEHQVGDVLSGLAFPVQLTSGSKGLVQRAFAFISGPRHAPELSNALDNIGASSSMWVQLMFLDEAYFHCAMAVSLTALDKLLLNQDKPKETMYHLSQALRLVNERLSGNNAVSDATIAVVVTLSHFERVQGQHRQGVIHLEGLRRMVELRGGVSQLAKNTPGIVPKIFRADLDFSLHLGTATRFSIGEIISTSTAVFGIPHRFKGQDENKLSEVHHPLLFKRLSVDLQGILIDIKNLAWMINEASSGHTRRLNHCKFHDTLILLGYRLIQFSPLGGPRPSSPLENAVHLGLFTFLMTLLRGLDRRIENIPLLRGLVSSAAQDHFDDDQDNQELLLWILFIGATSIFKPPEDVWMILKTSRTINDLGLHNWKDASRKLLKFPWVSAVHDEAGQALWQRSISLNGPAARVTSK